MCSVCEPVRVCVFIGSECLCIFVFTDCVCVRVLQHCVCVFTVCLFAACVRSVALCVCGCVLWVNARLVMHNVLPDRGSARDGAAGGGSWPSGDKR